MRGRRESGHQGTGRKGRPARFPREIDPTGMSEGHGPTQSERRGGEGEAGREGEEGQREDPLEKLERTCFNVVLIYSGYTGVYG